MPKQARQKGSRPKPKALTRRIKPTPAATDVAASARKAPASGNQYRFTLFTENGSETSLTRGLGEGSRVPSDIEPEEPGRSDEENHEDDVSETEPNRRQTTRKLAYIVDLMRNDVRTKSSSDKLEAWNLAARHLGRTLTMFLRTATAFNIGLDVDCQDEGGGSSDSEPVVLQTSTRSGLSAPEIKELTFQTDVMINTMPNLRSDIDMLLEDPTALAAYARYIDNRVRAARSDDQGSLAKHYLKFLNLLPDNKTARIPHHLRKADRGFFNVHTGRLLCPQDQLAEFDVDPEGFCTAMRNGERSCTSDDFPSFLYDTRLAEANPEDPVAGLLRGPFLLACFRCLFTGPATALGDKSFDEKGPGRPPIAATYGLTEVDPRHIAYVAVLARFVLNSQAAWNRRDGAFDGAVFHAHILNVFEIQDWAAETLSWWNREVYAGARPQALPETTAPRPGSIAARIANMVTRNISPDEQ